MFEALIANLLVNGGSSDGSTSLSTVCVVGTERRHVYRRLVRDGERTSCTSYFVVRMRMKHVLTR
jgi:hypothetical protein